MVTPQYFFFPKSYNFFIKKDILSNCAHSNTLRKKRDINKSFGKMSIYSSLQKTDCKMPSSLQKHLLCIKLYICNKHFMAFILNRCNTTLYPISHLKPPSSHLSSYPVSLLC